MTKIIKIPGIVDTHVHLRDPGATHKEDFYTGTCAALAGGVTAIIDMPNNPQPTISLKAIIRKKKIAAKKCVCDYGFHFGADNKNWLLHPKAAKKTYGIKVFMDQTTGPLLVTDLKILENHFLNWPKDKPLMVHAEDATLAKAIGLAMTYDKWLHVCHLNKEAELELVAKAKKKGACITVETCPHYLCLTDKEDKLLWPFSKMRPPLATKKDVQALWKGIELGLIDTIATDHAPHTIQEKKSSEAPCGVPGLETSLSLMLNAVNQRKLSLKKLINLMSVNPGKLFNIKQKNSWVEVNINKSWKVDNKKLFTKCGWSLFDGWKLKGKVVKVFIRGKKVFEDGEVLVKKGFGKEL